MPGGWMSRRKAVRRPLMVSGRTAPISGRPGICCSGYKDVSIQVCSTPRPMGVPVRALLPGSVWRDGWMPAAPGPKRPASLTAGRRPC